MAGSIQGVLQFMYKGSKLEHVDKFRYLGVIFCLDLAPLTCVWTP